MVNNRYAKAYTEVLEIIKYFPDEELSKIPQEKIEFYKNNMDNEYNFQIDPKIDLIEQNVSKEAGAIIVSLFRDYYATEEQKNKLNELIKLNERLTELNKSIKYNSDDLFKTNKENPVNKETSVNLPIIIEEKSFFKKIISFIKNLFNK